MAIKTRKQKTSPNTVGSERGVIQLLAANDNKTRIRQGQLTPWQKAKAKRLAMRKAAGKTYANWEKKNSTYKTTGPNAA